MITLLKKTYHVPLPVITPVRCVEGITIREDGSRQPWVWYPTEDQYLRFLNDIPRKDQ